MIILSNVRIFAKMRMFSKMSRKFASGAGVGGGMFFDSIRQCVFP